MKDVKKCGKMFPLFLNLQDKEILVVGAGSVARRRIETLLGFECNLKVVALEAHAFTDPRITYIEGEFQEMRLEGCDLVLAATNHPKVNERIYKACKTRNILVNVCDRKELCDFYFPAIFQTEDLVGGLVSKEGNQHSLVKNTAEAIRTIL